MDSIRNKKYPLRHLSLRVPWHDNGWDGSICKNPSLNESCLILPRISAEKQDLSTDNIKGKSLKDLKPTEYPVFCLLERSTFMAPFSFTLERNHPYQNTSPDTHGHFDTTALRFTPYSAVAIPYYWMLRNNTDEIAKYHQLDFDDNREPELSFPTGWVQELNNQKSLLDCFFGHIEPETSLCFFYAKRVPFYEGSGRVLIGVGRVKKIGDPVEYNYKAKGGLRSMLWERMITHSIRPGFQDGFLLPYYEAIEYAKENKDFDPSEIAVIIPNDKMFEFSYCTEHVTNDTAIRVLLECKKSLEISIEKEIPGNFSQYLKWIDERLNELEKIRGDYPGLGSALNAFGIETGHFIAREIVEKIGEDENPWAKVDEMFRNPESVLSKTSATKVTPTLAKTWLSMERDRKDLLCLLSRFDINHKQATILFNPDLREKEYRIKNDDKEILNNPYLISEFSSDSEEPISVWTIDMGFFSSGKTKNNLLPKGYNITDKFDYRRVRGFSVYLLESAAANQGNTLLPRDDLLGRIRDLPLNVDCKITQDIMKTVEEDFSSAIKKVYMKDKSSAYQLVRLNKTKNLINEVVAKRLNGKRHSIEVNWRQMLDRKLGTFNLDDEDELNARIEKTEAIKEVANSRISVLVGSAGTGKTTLLSVLCEIDEIFAGGILLLAPTGKARVRMSQVTAHLKLPALTIAQFLGKYNRYDYERQIYHLSDKPGCTGYETVIIDESSMLTEEMLAALFECLRTSKRIILVGDPQQLPPIGSGRPFVDIVNYLSPKNIENIFPKVGKSYAELIITRRQNSSSSERKNGRDNLDLQLAEWYRNKPLGPGQDSVWDDIAKNNSESIKFIRWDTEDEIRTKILKLLASELNLSDDGDVKSFNSLLGAKYDEKGYGYYNRGIANNLEKWQILSPVRGRAFGVTQINRLIHKTFKNETIKFAREKYNIPKPMGSEEIVYGDKVINLINKRKKCFPDNGEGYVANGEIGIAVGQLKASARKAKDRPGYLNIEFSSQVGITYGFLDSKDFKEEMEASLELAYALTVHKAQGSEFELVFLIIPNPCFLLSRELLYTALTRQSNKIIVLHQGELNLLRDYSTDLNSEIAKRLTNIFADPSPKEIQKGKFLEERLINCASNGVLLRSKSELIIFERLIHFGLNPVYEKELKIGDGTKLPDFTIEDPDTGINYYWEHCGMLNNFSYRKKWEQKKDWYYRNGIRTKDEGEGERGVLIITKDTEEGGISVPEIDDVIKINIK